MEKSMDKIVALAKSRGFVYPGSEIYGGLANTWDYGNLGVELKKYKNVGNNRNKEKSVVAEIHHTESVQCRRRLCDSDESADVGGFRTSRRFLGSADGL